MTTKAQLQAEVDFLLERCGHASRIRFDDTQRWTGVSSNALVRFIFTGEEPADREYPADVSDLAACYRTVYRLPEHLKTSWGRANDLLVRYRRKVAERYDLAEMDRRLASESKGGKPMS